MKLLLLLALGAGPTLYEWTDAKGGLHYTDDPSTIPATAKRKVTTGAELMITPPAEKGDAGVAVAPPPAPDTCAEGRRRVSQLERQLQDAKLDGPKTEERENERCQEQLRLMGQAAFARCMAGRTKAPSKGAVEALQAQLESAQDTLRRAQISGCH